MVDIISVPDGLEDAVGKPEDQQVLHRFLAKVMVDAVHLLFVEHRHHLSVELAGGLQVHAEGLLNYDPHPRVTPLRAG